jgi:hypothetical protein
VDDRVTEGSAFEGSAFEGSAFDGSAFDGSAFEGGGGAGRRLPAVVVAVLLVLAVADGELTLDPSPSATPATEVAEPIDVVPQVLDGEWVAMADAPVPARTRHTATWTGREVLIYGGQPDPGEASGVRYDPATGEWIAMAPSPLGSRVGHTATWTGTELVVFEGAPVGQSAAVAAQDIDGAAYDPATDTWRPIARAPINPRSGHVALWTGREVMVFGGSRIFEHQAPAAMYDPVADSWRLTADSPLDRAFGLTAAVWTGTEAVIWSGTGPEDVAAYDPVTDVWRLLPGSPLAMRSVSAVWTGEEMLLLGLPDGDRDQVGGLALDVEEERWSVLPPSPQAFAATFSAVWTGTAAVVVGGPREDVGAAWTPSTGRWQELPVSPQPAISGHAAAWTGDAVLVWGGQGDSSPLNTGALLRPTG